MTKKHYFIFEDLVFFKFSIIIKTKKELLLENVEKKSLALKQKKNENTKQELLKAIKELENYKEEERIKTKQLLLENAHKKYIEFIQNSNDIIFREMINADDELAEYAEEENQIKYPLNL